MGPVAHDRAGRRGVQLRVAVRSDHLTDLFGDATQPLLETWASLTWLATATSRIWFGPLVCPLTFDQPAILAKRAAAVDQLSGGRFELGIGAGWPRGTLLAWIDNLLERGWTVGQMTRGHTTNVFAYTSCHQIQARSTTSGERPTTPRR